MVDITVEDWCESFLTCFQSLALKKRCLKDFYFHKRLFVWRPRQQAFIFEIGTYLPPTRIQVNYCPYRYSYHNRFSVNIIHCDSAGTYNGTGTYLIWELLGQVWNRQTFEPATPNILFWSVVQQCWIRFYNSSDIVGATHAHYTCLKSLMGCILSTTHYMSQYCLELLHPFPNYCQHGRNNS